MNLEVDGPTYLETEPSVTAEVSRQADEVGNLPQRIARYSTAKQRAVQMSRYLQSINSAQALKAWAYLNTCGEYLHFRYYFTVGQVRLHAANFCKQHLICPLCAIRRGAKHLRAYLERYEVIRKDHPELWPYLITYTVRDGPYLEERFEHLHKSFQRIQDRRRNWNKSIRGAPWTEFAKVQGAVGSYEFKRGKGSGLWHPHLHLIGLCSSEPLQADLKREWEGITGDSFMVDVRPFDGSQDPVEGFFEVFKYAIKFSSLSLEDNWQAALTFARRRLLFSFGLFRGAQVPEDLTDEPLDSLPYIDLFYRWLGSACGYSLTAGVGLGCAVAS